MKLTKKLITAVFLLAGIKFCAFCTPLTLNSVCKDLSSNSVTSGDFVQIKTISTSKGPRELKSAGNFIFCLQGILWNTQKPFPSQMIITLSKITQTNAKGVTSTIEASENPTFSSIAKSLTAVFSGDISVLEENFKTEFSQDSGNSWTINLYPKNEVFAKSIQQIKLSGNLNTNEKAQLDEIELSENQNSKIKYLFQNQKFKKELSENEKALFY